MFALHNLRQFTINLNPLPRAKVTQNKNLHQTVSVSICLLFHAELCLQCLFVVFQCLQLYCFVLNDIVFTATPGLVVLIVVSGTCCSHRLNQSAPSQWLEEIAMGWICFSALLFLITFSSHCRGVGVSYSSAAYHQES